MKIPETEVQHSRRALLCYLLGSPFFLAAGPLRSLEDITSAANDCAPALADAVEVIASPADAINVFDFRAVAEQRLSAAHWAYLSTGVDHEIGLRANRAGFAKYGLRPRRLVDVRDLDTSTTVLGTALASPVVLAPVGAQRAFHPEGEIAVARAAKAKNQLQILSTASSASLDEVASALGAPPWLQLYTTRVWLHTRGQLKQAEDAGCQVVVLTVDLPGFGSQDRLRRFRGPGYPFRSREDPACYACHSGRLVGPASRLAEGVGIDPRELVSDALTLDWDYVDRIRDATSMKLVVKGILTHEDARLCLEHGIDGIIVSNHGARQIDNALSTIEVLPEISAVIGDGMPILIDSGFRRGTDVFMALALGASAVCIGRPYLWGLSAFGEEGVEAVLTIMRAELEAVMRQMGTPDIGSVSGTFVRSIMPVTPREM